MANQHPVNKISVTAPYDEGLLFLKEDGHWFYGFWYDEDWDSFVCLNKIVAWMKPPTLDDAK